MAHAFRKDIWRTIVQSRKRFISILIICVLGVTMVTGLRASCFDLRNSTDAFFDSQQLYDVSIQSTLGLSADDVEAVSKLMASNRRKAPGQKTRIPMQDRHA